MQPLRVKAGMVFVTRSKATRTPSRRVVEMACHGVVVYCTGGASLRRCSVREFRCWVRRYAAVRTRARRPRTMVLRHG